MRIGSNPQKKNYKVDMTSNHRIVMVVFIPELKGYYESMFDVIKTSLKSLVLTIPSTSKITIVDNGSCDEVQDYLTKLLKSKEIDSLQLLTENIGKIDALIGAARASREPIITLTDCDILFKPNWVEETVNIFNSFKNVSSVSPIPIRRGFNYFTFSTKVAIWKKRIKLRFLAITENFEEYNNFLDSINWDKETNSESLWPVVESNSTKAIVGSDHQVLTLRRDVLFNNTPKNPSFIKVGSESEQNYVDLPIDTSKGLRLSTYNYFAMHIGNNLEVWMKNEFENYKYDKNKSIDLKLSPSIIYDINSIFNYKLKKKLIKTFFRLKTPKGY